jgi:hypothetical protein
VSERVRNRSRSVSLNNDCEFVRLWCLMIASCLYSGRWKGTSESE